jgi:hypothetical protein
MNAVLMEIEVIVEIEPVFLSVHWIRVRQTQGVRSAAFRSLALARASRFFNMSRQ